MVLGGPAVSNGADVAPAVITRVWSDELVNVMVFPDGSDQPRAATSVRLCRDEDRARAHLAGVVASSAVPVAYWPAMT